MRVALFVTCLVDQLFPQVGLNTVRILERCGVEVRFDPRQTCCGQPAYNTGYRKEAERVARHFLDVYRDIPDPIVMPSGSCCTMARKFLPSLYPQGSKERQVAEETASRCFELSDFLVTRLGIDDLGSRFAGSVTYHDSCHLLRELKISEQPRRLIRKVRGIDFREMENSDRCCGFGGTFSIKFPDVSAAIGEDKVKWIQESGAGYVVGNDVSCLMHLDGILKRRRIPVKTMHLTEILSNFDD